MGDLKSGDCVVCHLHDGVIVAPSDPYQTMDEFVIVSTDSYGYYLYVPSYIHLNGSSLADSARCQKLSIERRFIDEQIVYITAGLVCKEVKRDGARCARCTDFVLMAEANQSDGKTFICQSCRTNKYR